MAPKHDGKSQKSVRIVLPDESLDSPSEVERLKAKVNEYRRIALKSATQARRLTIENRALRDAAKKDYEESARPERTEVGELKVEVAELRATNQQLEEANRYLKQENDNKQRAFEAICQNFKTMLEKRELVLEELIERELAGLQEAKALFEDSKRAAAKKEEEGGQPKLARKRKADDTIDVSRGGKRTRYSV